MKDLIEQLLYPHNIFLWGFFLAVIRYRKSGLVLLWLWFYSFGNGFVANQVRDWYNQRISTSEISKEFTGHYVVLGCGGSAETIPDCAKSRLDQLVSHLQTNLVATTVHITTLFCEPYKNYLKDKIANKHEINCFHGGATTYHEFYQLSNRLDRRIPLIFISSDYHAFRLRKLADQYAFSAEIYAAPSSTFRPVNCGIRCFLTVNLSNYDLFAKLTAEMSSYYVYALTKGWLEWHIEK